MADALDDAAFLTDLERNADLIGYDALTAYGSPSYYVQMELLTGGLTDANSLAEPMKVAPKSSTTHASAKFGHEFPGHTVSVIRFSTK